MEARVLADLRAGAKASLPTAVGYVSIGIACGIVGANSHLSALEMGLMSLIVYAGASQFVMCSLFAAHASFLTVIITTFLVNFRFFLMSLHSTTLFEKTSLLNKIGIGSLITDESYGVLLNELNKQKPTAAWMHGNNVFGYVTWVVAVLIGTIVGGAIPSPESFGLDYALVAMFVAILASQLLAARMNTKLRAIIGVLVAVLVSYFGLAVVTTSSLSVLGSTICGCVVGVCLDEY